MQHADNNYRQINPDRLLVSTFAIMGLVQTQIYDALQREAYRRNVA